MARFVLQLRDGREKLVDDYRPRGQFVEYIEPYTHEIRAINANDVVGIREARGFEKGILLGLSQGPKFPDSGH